MHLNTDNASDESTNQLFLRDDLAATARVIFFLLFEYEAPNTIEVHDLSQTVDIEIATLILALQQGMTAAQGLNSAAFETLEQKHTLLGELNSCFKELKPNKDAKTQEILNAAEENAWLVIGQQGSWNKLFHVELLKSFALTGGGYKITSFVDLLRVIRNILQHHQENPKAITTAFDLPTMPSIQRVLQLFLDQFPYLYPHAYCCYHELFNEKQLADNQSHIRSYKLIETHLSTSASAPELPKRSNFRVCFLSIHDDAVWRQTRSRR